MCIIKIDGLMSSSVLRTKSCTNKSMMYYTFLKLKIRCQCTKNAKNIPLTYKIVNNNNSYDKNPENNIYSYYKILGPASQ